MKRRTGLWVLVCLIFLLAGLRVYGLYSTQRRDTQSTAVEQLFAAKLPDPHGAVSALSRWEGHALLANFWASWCAPCVEEMPALTALQDEIGNHRVQFIGIGVDTSDNIRAFLKRIRFSYPVYIGGVDAIQLSQALGNAVNGLPFTVLIDAQGKIRRIYMGKIPMDKLRKDLESL